MPSLFLLSYRSFDPCWGAFAPLEIQIGARGFLSASIYTREMTSADSPVPRAQPRREPRWLVVLMSLGVVLVLGGALLVVFNPPTLTFGWFAYAPVSE